MMSHDIKGTMRNGAASFAGGDISTAFT